MLPQVQRIADPYGIAVHSSGGFDSLTAKHDLAVTLGQWPQVEVLHIGDHDPSGVHLFTSMAEDVRAIAGDLGLDADIRFSRLAVTPAQIAELPCRPRRRNRPTGDHSKARRCNARRSRQTCWPRSSGARSSNGLIRVHMPGFSTQSGKYKLASSQRLATLLDNMGGAS